MKLILFAKLHDIYGKNEIVLDERIESVSDLKKLLMERYPELYEDVSFIVCNDRYLNDSDDIHDCDEILLFPRFSGG
ncbi:MAG: MoaD/ThiS family protein [Thermoplasmata archaeon]